MNNVKIEKLAVNAINQRILTDSDNIDINIDTNDKTISFDGNIINFSDDSMTKRSFLDSIPVQVKGKGVDKFSGKSAKYYDFTKEDFKNFQLVDGVLIFFVEILKSRNIQSKIFYKFLDANTLEKLLLSMKTKNRETKVIELYELDDSISLDQLFYQMAINRKVSGFTETKLDTFLQNDSSFNVYADDFEKTIVSQAEEKFSDVEFKNIKSQFNILLKRDMEYILQQDTLVDGLLLANLVVQIRKFNLLEILPSTNKRLAILVKARYYARINDYSTAQIILSNYLNNYDINDLYYKKISLEANFGSIKFPQLIEESNLKEVNKNKYLAKYYFENNDFIRFYHLLKKYKNENVEWEYLYGKHLIYTMNYDEGLSKLKTISKQENFLELQLEELNYRLRTISDTVIFEKEDKSSELLEMLNDLENIREQLGSYPDISIPLIEKLDFRIKAILNPKKELETVRKLLAKNETNYLLQMKIELLILTNHLEYALHLINKTTESEYDFNLLRLKVFILNQKNRQKELYKFLFDLLNKDLLFENGMEFFIHMFMFSARDYPNINVEEFEILISKLSQKKAINLPSLISLETTRNMIKSVNYGNDFMKIKEDFADYPDINKVEYIKHLLLQNNELNFAFEMYPEIRKVNSIAADEILTNLLVYNHKYQEVIDLLSNYNQNELTKLLTEKKAVSLNHLHQYPATIQLYQDTKFMTDEFLNQVLIAKINLHDKENIESIIDKGFSSKNFYFKIHSAVALNYFNINRPRAIQTLIKYILESKFNNQELNENFISTFLCNIQKIDLDDTIDQYHNFYLKYYKFKKDDTKIKILIIPNNWKIENFDNYNFFGTDSEIHFRTREISVGDSLTIENEEYILIEELPLSTYIFRLLIDKESGDLAEGKIVSQIQIKDTENIIENLVNMLSKYDNTKRYEVAEVYYENYHAPFIYDTVLSFDRILDFYIQMITNRDYLYYTGNESLYNENTNYQISITSLILLSSLDLLHILDAYTGIYIENTQSNWLEHLLTNEKKDFGSINVIKGKLVYYEDNEKNRIDLQSHLMEVFLKVKSLPKNYAKFIKPEFTTLTKIQNASIQIAFDKKRTLFLEDEALQTILLHDYQLPTTSIGTLISHYFLSIKEDIDSYLEVLILALDLNNAWELHPRTNQKLLKLVELKDSTHTQLRYNLWHKKYFDRFINK